MHLFLVANGLFFCHCCFRPLFRGIREKVELWEKKINQASQALTLHLFQFVIILTTTQLALASASAHFPEYKDPGRNMHTLRVDLERGVLDKLTKFRKEACKLEVNAQHDSQRQKLPLEDNLKLVRGSVNCGSKRSNQKPHKALCKSKTNNDST